MEGEDEKLGVKSGLHANPAVLLSSTLRSHSYSAYLVDRQKQADDSVALMLK